MYAPGVTQPQTSSFNSLSGGGRPYVNGQLQQANNFTIDGVDTNKAIRLHRTSRAPTPWNRSASKPTTIRPSSGT